MVTNLYYKFHALLMNIRNQGPDDLFFFGMLLILVLLTGGFAAYYHGITLSKITHLNKHDEFFKDHIYQTKPRVK